MDINAEKEYIYGMMKAITEERRVLTDIYWDLKKRLDELNQLEERGLTDLSIKGYSDLLNKYNEKFKELAVTNIKRETDHIIQKINDDINENKNDTTNEENIVSSNIVSKREIEVEKDKEPKKKTYLNVSKVKDIIVNILKESGKEMTLDELVPLISERVGQTVKKHNLQNNIMPKLVKENKNIKKPKRGRYQYISE